MSMPNSNLWFITVNSIPDALDFTNWLKGKRKVFNDTMEFRDWLEAYRAFPLEIYLDGLTYRFRTREEATFFLLGFEAALNAIRGV